MTPRDGRLVFTRFGSSGRLTKKCGLFLRAGDRGLGDGLQESEPTPAVIFSVVSDPERGENFFERSISTTPAPFIPRDGANAEAELLGDGGLSFALSAKFKCADFLRDVP